MSLNTGRSVAKIDESERNNQNLALPTPRFARKFSTWNPGVWDGTFGRKRRQIPGKAYKQCVGKNDRFRTVLGSVVDHIAPKKESVFDISHISCVFVFHHAIFTMFLAC